MPTMLQISVALVASGVIALSACTFIAPNSDGSSCGSNDDCKSKTCHDGFCIGSSCKTAGDCETGWSCVYDDGIFGIGSSQRCQPACGHCPPDYQCLSPDTSPPALCTPNAGWKNPVVAIDQPAHDDAGSRVTVHVGVPTTFHGTAISPAGNGIATFAWVADSHMASGDTAMFTFDPSDVNGNAQVTLTVTDSAGNQGSQSLDLDICADVGFPCTPGTFGLCCGGLTCKGAAPNATTGSCAD